MNKFSKDLIDKMEQIKLFAFDSDGVLTDGGMYYSETGDELKKFNTRDGGGILLLKLVGIKTALVTSETIGLIQRRATKLQIDHCIQTHTDKWTVLQKFLSNLKLSPDQVSYIGDDINDLTVMEKVGLSMAVADAVADVQKMADIILKTKGGNGAVREGAEAILRSTNQYEQALLNYFDHKKKMS